MESLVSELDNLALKLGEIEVEHQHGAYNVEAVENSSSPGFEVRNKSSAGNRNNIYGENASSECDRYINYLKKKACVYRIV